MSTALCCVAASSLCSNLPQRSSRTVPSLCLRNPATSQTLPTSSTLLSDALCLRTQRLPARENRAKRHTIRMGKVAPDGVFTPFVIAGRQVLGQKTFNGIRGKAISLHSQVIKTFCQQIGAEQRQIQGLIRLAKQNGGKLGFLS